MLNPKWLTGFILLLALLLTGCAPADGQASAESKGDPVGVVYRTPS